MSHQTTASRRKFLNGLAKAGMLLPFAGQLLGQSVFAQTGGAKRVLFLYHPNGVVPASWRPVQDNGSITTSAELSFSLGSLQRWHDRIIVFKNLYIHIGEGAGAHEKDMQGVLTGNRDISADSASIDHLIAEQLGNEGVLNLGVRTGNGQGKDGGVNYFISKARGEPTGSRASPTNDPRTAAEILAARLGGSGGDDVSDLKRQFYETLLADFDSLADATLEASRQAKLDAHINALRRLRDQAGMQVGECSFRTDVISDPYFEASNLSPEQYALYPDLCRAQIDNAVGAFSCGLHRVATLMLSRGDENGGRVHYGWGDDYWQMVQLGVDRGLGSLFDRNHNNAHTSHAASHNIPFTHAVQGRFYNSLLAYALEQLQAKGILEDTLVVLFSEVGNGSQHGGGAGSVVLAGGAGGSLPMGRVITCGDGNNNGVSLYGTHHLFGDIARLMGVNTSGFPSWWKSGVIT